MNNFLIILWISWVQKQQLGFIGNQVELRSTF